MWLSEVNDFNQFATQINKVNKILGKKCETACADCGYASTDDLEKIDKQGIKVIVPSQRQVTKKEPSSQEIYKLRKQKVELPYGHIKHNLKFDSFLLRGLKGAKAEASIISTCFNLVRMITFLGVPGLIKELNAY